MTGPPRCAERPAPFELIYRIGGEEFLVVLPGTDINEAQHIAERLRKTVQDAQPGGLPVTASFGVSCGVGEAADFVQLLNAADQALYAAKRSGRNVVMAAASTDGPAWALTPTPSRRVADQMRLLHRG